MIVRFAVFTVVLWCLVALFGGFLPLTPNEVNLERILSAPSSEGLLGYDELGRPVLDRIIVGAWTSFVVAIWVVSISLIVGTCIGCMSAWLGGVVDHFIVRVIDVFLAFPGILLAIVLAGVLGPGIENVVIALSLVGWVGFARLSRAQTLSVRHREHIQAAIVLGVGTPQIVWRHVVPLILAPLIVEGSFGIAAAVVAEAGLSFLGLGVQPPAASWGSMIRDGTSYLLVAPHLVMAPGLALAVIVLSVNLLGDRLRDHLDTTTRFD